MVLVLPVLFLQSEVRMSAGKKTWVCFRIAPQQSHEAVTNAWAGATARQKIKMKSFGLRTIIHLSTVSSYFSKIWSSQATFPICFWKSLSNSSFWMCNKVLQLYKVFCACMEKFLCLIRLIIKWFITELVLAVYLHFVYFVEIVPNITYRYS